MSSFENLRIVDNFYQTSLYFPMPTVIISTLCEDGSTTLGPYSLVQPYYVAGKDYYAMLLCCRNSSNTAQNILRNGKCALNFIDDNPKSFKEAVKLSWPGDKPSDKMPKCNFRLETSLIEEQTPFALSLVDLDNFKSINDNYGHRTGDDMLSRTAADLRRVTGENGVVGRYGGDEFLIVFFGSTDYDRYYYYDVKDVLKQFKKFLKQWKDDEFGYVCFSW